MKKTFNIILAILGVCLFASCDSSKTEDSPLVTQIEGEWHLSSWTGDAPADFDAYMAFSADRTFVIYQLIEKSRYQLLTGSYTISGSVLSGVYSDGTPWGSKYEIKFDESNNKLTTTSNTPIQEVSDYLRKPIPADVKSSAIPVRAGFCVQKRLL